MAQLAGIRHWVGALVYGGTQWSDSNHKYHRLFNKIRMMWKEQHSENALALLNTGNQQENPGGILMSNSFRRP
jgi:hypothetical protein